MLPDDELCLAQLEACASRHELREREITADAAKMLRPGEQSVKRQLQDMARRHSRVAYECRAAIRAIKATGGR